MIRIDTSNLSAEEIKQKFCALKAGDVLSLSGRVYTARDAAHKKIKQAIDSGQKLPFDLNGAILYYAGPTPEREGMVIGSCGPTTSSRMDRFAPELYDRGVAATIGKGERSAEVAEACKRNQSVYLCAVGGAGALAAKNIGSKTVIAFEDLGCESVKELVFQDFPLTVAVDSQGNDLFEKRRKNCEERTNCYHE